MIYKLLEKGDITQAKELWGYAFEKNEPFYSWYFEEVFQPENTMGVFSEDQLVACLQINPYEIFLNGSSFKTSYIVGVITDPAYRGKGLSKDLMRSTLKEMNDRNHFVSILMPFDTTFYRPYGWELYYSQLSYEVPIHMLKGFGHHEGNFQRVDISKDINSLKKVYTAFTKNYHGYIQRSSHDWEMLLKDLSHDGGHAYLLRNEQQEPMGYVLYFLKEEGLYAKEMGYVNPWAKKSLFGFLYGHTSQTSSIQWSAPLGDATYLFLRDTIMPKPTNNIKIHPFMCGRIVNVKKAFEACSFEKDVNFSFSMEIHDSYAPWNEGIFLVTIREGIPSVSTPLEQTPDFSCTINHLSQLFFGALGFQEGLDLELIMIHKEEVIEDLSKIFTRKNNFINEYF